MFFALRLMDRFPLPDRPQPDLSTFWDRQISLSQLAYRLEKGMTALGAMDGEGDARLGELLTIFSTTSGIWGRKP